jgi:hypothetical protein
MNEFNSLLDGVRAVAGVAVSQSSVDEAHEPPAAEKSSVSQMVTRFNTEESSRIEIQKRSRESYSATCDGCDSLARPARGAQTKGPCHKCGVQVTLHVPLAGLVNWFGRPVHLSCPPSDLSEPEGFSDLDEQPSPPPFDEHAFAQMCRDFREVAKKWRAAGKYRPSPDKVVYGTAETCGTCGGTDWWHSAVKPGPWNCRTCQPPNARRNDVVFRFAHASKWRWPLGR